MADVGSLKVGDKVTSRAMTDVNGTHLASFTRTTTYQVIQVGGKNLPDTRIVIGLNGQVTAAVDIQYLDKVGVPTPTPKPEPVPVTPAPQPQTMPATEDRDVDLNNIRRNNVQVSVSGNEGSISRSSVQYGTERLTASASAVYADSINQVGESYRYRANETIQKIERDDPSIIQNSANFPPTKGFSNGRYKYNYYIDLDRDGMTSDLNAVRKSVNIDIMNRNQLFNKYVTEYNRFKLANQNDFLSKTFAHIFFIRPDLNIFKPGGGLDGRMVEINPSLDNLAEFYYAKKHDPDLLRQLTQHDVSYNHQFNLLLSNKAKSFQLSDEYITTDQYGQGFTGYKIPYGKTDIESKNAKEFSISYKDDRDLHVYQEHKLWTQYISHEYRGKILPRTEYILEKIIDYATCVYYILCAEDGETIIFWSKYWGVFPKDAPSSQFSYTADNAGGVSNPELQINYQYAWKEDFNPLTLVEFNKHGPRNFRYVPTFNTYKAGTGYTWVGAPFVETLNSGAGGTLPYTFKLRFRTT